MLRLTILGLGLLTAGCGGNGNSVAATGKDATCALVSAESDTELEQATIALLRENSKWTVTSLREGKPPCTPDIWVLVMTNTVRNGFGAPMGYTAAVSINGPGKSPFGFLGAGHAQWRAAAVEHAVRAALFQAEGAKPGAFGTMKEPDTE